MTSASGMIWMLGVIASVMRLGMMSNVPGSINVVLVRSASDVISDSSTPNLLATAESISPLWA